MRESNPPDPGYKPGGTRYAYSGRIYAVCVFWLTRRIGVRTAPTRNFRRCCSRLFAGGGREFPVNRINLSPHRTPPWAKGYGSTSFPAASRPQRKHATAAFLMTDVAQGTIPVRPIIPPHIWLTKETESLNGLVVVRTSSGDGSTQKSDSFPGHVGGMPGWFC